MTHDRAAFLEFNRGIRRAADDYNEHHKQPDEPEPPQPRPPKTHCIHGHKFSKKNTYVDSRGWKTCRTCAATRRRHERARKKNTDDQ